MPSWPAPEATGIDAPAAAGALPPWISNALLPNHYRPACCSASWTSVRYMQRRGVTPLEIAADLQAARELFGAIANEWKD